MSCVVKVEDRGLRATVVGLKQLWYQQQAKQEKIGLGDIGDLIYNGWSEWCNSRSEGIMDPTSRKARVGVGAGLHHNQT